MKTNSNTQMCWGWWLGTVVSVCVLIMSPDCLLVPGCRVSLFSSRSLAAGWLLIVWNDFLPLFVIPISRASPHPGTRHNKTWHYPHWYSCSQYWVWHHSALLYTITQVAIFRSYLHNNIIPIVSVHIVAINEMISMQCKPNVKCLQIPRYPGEVRSCLVSRISVASRVPCPSAGTWSGE